MATMTMDFSAPRIARPAVRSTTAPTNTSVRLTARGRLVVRAVVAFVATLLAFVMLSLGQGAIVSAMTDAPASVASHSIVVRSGETLWQIAIRELPNTDPRDGISRIRTLNGMAPTDSLLAGETLEIPTV